MKKAFVPTLALGVAAAALTAGASSAHAAGFRSCNAVRAAGLHTPIPFGDPNYQANLDRDNDGWACEPAGVNLPDPRKATKPAPVRPTKPAPAVRVPATQGPAQPAKPAQPLPAKPGMGPKVSTDFVASHDSSATGAATFGLFAAAAGAGAWRVRTARKR